MLGALSLLAIAASAGTRVDLADLMEPKDYLKAQTIETDTNSLVGLIARESEAANASGETPELEGHAARQHAFLLQMICRELGQRQAQSAVAPLRRLAEHPDYFVAKRARAALDDIENGADRESLYELPEDVQKLLPDTARVGLAFPGTYRENARRLAGVAPPPALQMAVNRAVAAIGNLEVGRFVVVYDVRTGLTDSIALVLIDGHFYQDAVTGQLENLQIESERPNEDEWLGIYRSPLARLTVGVALVEGRRAAISLLSDPIDKATLLKLARAF